MKVHQKKSIKRDNSRSKIWMKYLGFIEEVAGHKNIDTAALLKTLVCFKELSKARLIDINEEDVMKRMMSQKKWHQETLHTKETLRDVSQTVSTEDKVLEVEKQKNLLKEKELMLKAKNNADKLALAEKELQLKTAIKLAE